MFLFNREGYSPGKNLNEHHAARLVTVVDPSGAPAEAYRALRASLAYRLVDLPHKVIATTGPGVGEGKSTTCANLGVVLAQAGSNTLILDCDLRKPAIHKFFGLRNLCGVVDVLMQENDLREVRQEPSPGLTVVSAGPIPPNPAELLSSRRFSEFIDQVRREFDYVLVDTTPIQLVSDALTIAQQSDGVLLVFDAQKTSKRSVQQSVGKLEGVGAHVLGTLMNNVRVPRRKNRDYATYAYR
jgi:capsular exopolysaccharide synthesis family protein